MEQQPSDQALVDILRTADGEEPTEAQLDAAAELESRRARILDLYEEADRVQEDDTPIDMEEYNRLVQVLPAELRGPNLAKDPKRLEAILKSVKDQRVNRTHDVEKLRAVKAQMELVRAILLQEPDSDAIRAHIRTAEGVTDAVRISEIERQIKAQAEQLEAQAKQLKAQVNQLEAQAEQLKALQDQANAMQNQISGGDTESCA
jgi:DNA repair exonuclease SbcCD ATPase subunit